MQHNPYRVIIIGGGITGLAAAHRLFEAQQDQDAVMPMEVTLLEANDYPGGTLRTVERDGFLVETGPDSFLYTKPWAVALSKRLGIDHRIIPTNPKFRRSHIVYRGALHPMPEGFLMLAPTKFWPMVTSSLFSWPGKLRMGLDLILPRGGYKDDESLGDFVARRLGREVLDRVVQPLVGGIYTGDPDVLSLRATMPRLLDMEEKHRSIIIGMWTQRRAALQRAREASDNAKNNPADSGARYSELVSFDRGMQTIVDELLARIPDGVIQLQQPVSALQRGENEWNVVMADGSRRSADAVIAAIPAHRAASLIKHLDPSLSSELASIQYASSAIVNLAFRREDVSHPLDGFGFVVPEIEGHSIIACSFSSIKFPGRAPEGFALLRAFVGGAIQAQLYDMDDDELHQMVMDDLGALLGIDTTPMWTMLHRWPLSMPQYHVGHLQLVERIRNRTAQHPGLAFVGNAYSGIGVPDCVHSGETAAEQALEQARQRVSAQPS